mgnify:CR=1 FL=1
MNAVTDSEVYKALLAIPVYSTSGEAEKSKDADALLAHEAIAEEISRTAGWFCREDRAQGPKLSFLISVQRGMLVHLIHERRPDQISQVVRMVRGIIRRRIEAQFGRNKKSKWDEDTPRARRPRHKKSKGSTSDGNEAMTKRDKERIWEWKIANPTIKHVDWAVEGDSGLPVVIRPRRRRGPRLNEDDTPGAHRWYS